MLCTCRAWSILSIQSSISSSAEWKSDLDRSAASKTARRIRILKQYRILSIPYCQRLNVLIVKLCPTHIDPWQQVAQRMALVTREFIKKGVSLKDINLIVWATISGKTFALSSAISFLCLSSCETICSTCINSAFTDSSLDSRGGLSPKRLACIFALTRCYFSISYTHVDLNAQVLYILAPITRAWSAPCSGHDD